MAQCAQIKKGCQEYAVAANDELPFSLYETREKALNAGVIHEGKKAPMNPVPPAGVMAGPVTFEDLLVAVGRTHNRDAFVRVFEHFAPRVKSFLMKGGLPPDVADEVAQETLITVWRRAVSYDPDRASASTWIFTIARNKRIDFLRKKKLPEVNMDDPLLVDDAEAPDEMTGRLQDSKAVAAALAKLPPEQAEMIRKAYYEEKSHSDIAAETNLPLGTVKSRIRLALAHLRENLGEGVVKT